MKTIDEVKIFNRIGNIRISIEMINDNPEYILNIMKHLGILVVATNYDFFTSSIRYTILSRNLPEIKTGKSLRDYTVNVTEKDGKFFHAEFVEI